MNGDNSASNWRSPEEDVQESSDRRLREYLDHRRGLVDEGICRFLNRHYTGQVLEIIDYMTHGGKCLRGVLAILVCEALGGRTDDALAAAIAIELAHAASLAHDDVMDCDVMRRGRPALHVRYDIPTAILIPHLIVPHSILSTRVYGSRATSVILKGWAQIVRGQVRDYVLANQNGVARPEDLERAAAGSSLEYFRIIRDKTAALFETAAVLGAIAAQDDSGASVAQSYARRLGIAFQIADDVTDLEAHRHEPWSTVLRAHTTSRSIRAIKCIVSVEEETITSSAIARARNLASINIRRAEKSASAFPSSSIRELLRVFPAFAVNQIYAEAQEDVRCCEEARNAVGTRKETCDERSIS